MGSPLLDETSPILITCMTPYMLSGCEIVGWPKAIRKRVFSQAWLMRGPAILPRSSYSCRAAANGGGATAFAQVSANRLVNCDALS